MPLNLQLSHYISGPIAGASLVFVYDFLTKTYPNQLMMYDSLIIASSIFASNLLKNVVLDRFIPISDNSLQALLIKVVMVTMLYNYGFNYFIRDNFPSIPKSSEMEVMLLGAIVTVSASYLENPLVSLLTNSF
jgi:hypothetical protein